MKANILGLMQLKNVSYLELSKLNELEHEIDPINV